MIIPSRSRSSEKARQEGRFWGGEPPYGWAIDDVTGRLVQERLEQNVIVRVEELSKKGWTPSRIAELLNEAGVATRRRKQWHASTIRRLIARAQGREERGRP